MNFAECCDGTKNTRHNVPPYFFVVLLDGHERAYSYAGWQSFLIFDRDQC
jgi:hypothetical protein